jgi:hypothetical protein
LQSVRFIVTFDPVPVTGERARRPVRKAPKVPKRANEIWEPKFHGGARFWTADSVSQVFPVEAPSWKRTSPRSVAADGLSRTLS